jgi:esterase/lipase
MVLVNERDDAVPTSHPQQVFDAITHNDKEFVEIADANHYFSGEGQRSPLSAAVDTVHAWMERHEFIR